MENGAEVVVLGRGMELGLQVCPQTLEWLKERSITAIVEETNQAVQSYNRLVDEGKSVGGLFHSTC